MRSLIKYIRSTSKFNRVAFFENPNVKLVGVLHTTVWITFVVLFSFGFLLMGFLAPSSNDNPQTPKIGVPLYSNLDPGLTNYQVSEPNLETVGEYPIIHSFDEFSRFFTSEFAKTGTFIAMFGIMFFLIFDYVVSGGKGDRGNVSKRYPNYVFF